MDDRVIEAAARAEYERVFGHIMPWSELADDLRACNLIEAETIITAALAALAPEIRTAVERLEQASEDFAQHYVSGPDGKLSDAWREEYKRRSDKQDDARRDLLALLGIDDATG